MIRIVRHEFSAGNDHAKGVHSYCPAHHQVLFGWFAARQRFAVIIVIGLGASGNRAVGADSAARTPV
jgi:hypothetical protein